MSKSILEKISSSRASDVYLVRGLNENRPAWYYIEVEKLKIPIFNELCENKSTGVNLAAFGRIIDSGWGDEPDNNSRKKIEEKYGI